MAHGYKTLHHWHQWLSQGTLGKPLLEAQSTIFSRLLAKHYGKHALIIGVPSQEVLMMNTHLSCVTIATPIIEHSAVAKVVECDLKELPFLTGTLDLVVLAHTLEMMDHPRQLLAEACRVVKPEGLIVISGFNPYSLWGLKRKYSSKKDVPWSNHFIYPRKLKNWLELHDFNLEQQHFAMYGFPSSHAIWHKMLCVYEWLGKYFMPQVGGVYTLIARAKVIQLRPIRTSWKQHLSNVRISPTVTGI